MSSSSPFSRRLSEPHWFHDAVIPHLARMWLVKGRVEFEDYTNVGNGHKANFDSIICLLVAQPFESPIISQWEQDRERVCEECGSRNMIGVPIVIPADPEIGEYEPMTARVWDCLDCRTWGRC